MAIGDVKYLGMAVAVFLGLGGVSCSHARPPQEAPATEAATATQPTAAHYEAELRDIIRKQIESAGRTADEGRAKLVYRRPYYLKEYDVFPDGPEKFELVVQEKESRSTPYVADVSVGKVRYATRLHRKRAEAEQDRSFLRDTGTDVMTYELRNGKWTEVGSMFVAQKSEENVNGEWLPVKETAKRTVAAEEEQAKGWFGRVWSKVTGR